MADPTPSPSFPLPGRPERAFRATRGDRFAARFIDNLVTMLPAALVGIVVGVAMSTATGSADLEALAALAVGSLIALGVWGWNMKSLVETGQTLGKRAMKIELIHSDGQRVDFVRGVLLREVAIFFASAIPGIGSLVSIADGALILLPDRRCAHDYLCSTEVVSLKNLDTSVNSVAMADVFR